MQHLLAVQCLLAVQRARAVHAAGSLALKSVSVHIQPMWLWGLQIFDSNLAVWTMNSTRRFVQIYMWKGLLLHVHNINKLDPIFNSLITR